MMRKLGLRVPLFEGSYRFYFLRLVRPWTSKKVKSNIPMCGVMFNGKSGYEVKYRNRKHTREKRFIVSRGKEVYSDSYAVHKEEQNG